MKRVNGTWFERKEPGTKEERLSRKLGCILVKPLCQVCRLAPIDLNVVPFPLASFLISFLTPLKRMPGTCFQAHIPGASSSIN